MTGNDSNVLHKSPDPEARAEAVLRCVFDLCWFWSNVDYLDQAADDLDAARNNGLEYERDRLKELHKLLTAAEWRALPGAIECVPRLERNCAGQDLPELWMLGRYSSYSEFLDALWREAAAAGPHPAARKLLERWRARFDSDFLEAARELVQTRQASLEIVRGAASLYVLEWCQREFGVTLDPDQAAAIAMTNGNALVAARAGSGKTRTIVTRAAFLVKHCRVAPSELLILAFNKKAATEIGDRLTSLECACPHVMTFHALAYALVHPEQSLVYDDEKTGNLLQTTVLQQVINGLLDQDEWGDRVRDLMLRHFRADWEHLIEMALTGSMAEGLAFRRSLVTETLRGEYVKSRGEQLIANFLFEHDVPYLYERNHWWKGRNYRPDFTLEGRNVVIEYFGLEGDPSYDEQSQEKRAFWAKKPDWRFLEYGPELVGSPGEVAGWARLRADLEALGVPLRRLSDEEIWERIRERTLTRFASTLRTFVGRCRKTSSSVETLADRLRRYIPADDLERRYLDIATTVLGDYLERLSQENREDFDGLMERAAQLVEIVTTAFDRKSGSGDLANIRFVMVDEFQDMSPLFIRLLKAIRLRNPGVQILGVGDDWQAINSFAGSDLNYFEGFESHFEPASRTSISTNYRSAQRVVDLGNKIMAGRGGPARSRNGAPLGSVEVADLADLCPAAEETSRWPGDQITPAVRRLLRAPVSEGKTVALLARRDGIPYFVPTKKNATRSISRLEALGQRWTEGMSKTEKGLVALSTAHSFKGKEADVVIVLDAVDRSYPLIHPDWIFTRVFGDSVAKLIDDERRLFYVACTRARERLILLTEGHRESEFLNQVRVSCETLSWSEFAPFVQDRGGWILKVGSAAGHGSSPTFERKDRLKAEGFAFASGEWPHWWISLSASLSREEVRERVCRAGWIEGPDGLEVLVCLSSGTVVETLAVSGGDVRVKRERREC